MNCIFCKKETNNPKFCSRSCAAKHNNVLFIKRPSKRVKLCVVCNNKFNFTINSSKFCSESCKNLYVDPKTFRTIKDVMYDKHHKSSCFAYIRTQARKIMSNHIQKCSKCSYDKHVEVCHIKSISSFPLDTLISTVNSLDNLLLLCPNCHWEFDNLVVKQNK